MASSLPAFIATFQSHSELKTTIGQRSLSQYFDDSILTAFHSPLGPLIPVKKYSPSGYASVMLWLMILICSFDAGTYCKVNSIANSNEQGDGRTSIAAIVATAMTYSIRDRERADLSAISSQNTFRATVGLRNTSLPAGIA